jgi:hypothetical protein
MRPSRTDCRRANNMTSRLTGKVVEDTLDGPGVMHVLVLVGVVGVVMRLAASIAAAGGAEPGIGAGVARYIRAGVDVVVAAFDSGGAAMILAGAEHVNRWRLTSIYAFGNTQTAASPQIVLAVVDFRLRPHHVECAASRPELRS